MAGARFVLRPAGNSLEIAKVGDPDLRDQVHQLYRSFWAVWSGPFDMLGMGLMSLILLPIFLLLTWQAYRQGAWLMMLLGVAGLWLIKEGGSHFLHSITSIKEGRQELARLRDELPRANEAFAALKRIEPWRTWLLKPFVNIDP